jgi:hypothetical protein
MRHVSSVALVSLFALSGACSQSSEQENPPGVGGTSTSGGSGGSAPAGGAGSGGATTAGSGGSGGQAAGNGGTAGTATGGNGGSSSGAGGTAGMGGSAGLAGSAGSTGGGMAGAGGAPGAGAGGAAGTAGTGTSGSGGSAGGPAVMPKAGMNFFVTSKGWSAGGKFDSLAAADAFCDELATAVSADLGEKTWRAYLSTSVVNAKDRIGTGPWRNQAGDIVANNVADLHAQEEGEALDGTWPPGDLGIALDETGQELPNSVHDILTGTNVDGTVNMAATCNDWTSNSADDEAQVGHSNRTGGGRPPYFNATHTVGCAPATDMNYETGTVTQGGGRGSIYCFALEPSSGP